MYHGLLIAATVTLILAASLALGYGIGMAICWLAALSADVYGWRTTEDE